MFKINFNKFFMFVFIATVTISCDNDPTSSGDEHLDVDGLAIELNGIEIYRELEGEVITNNISLNVNDTLHLTAHFLDHDGNELGHDDEHDDEHDDALSFQISNSDIILIMMDEHDDEHCDEITGQSECESVDHCEWHENLCEEEHDDGFEFELIGLSSGTTNFNIALMHNDHADYNSLSINVTVNDMFACTNNHLCIRKCCAGTIYAAK